MKQGIVLYVKGGRFASFEHTVENLADIKRQCYVVLIQKDVNGTEHYNCFPRGRGKRGTK